MNMSNRKANIIMGDVTLGVTLRPTPTANTLWAAMPFTATAQTWGDEVYFDTPVSAAGEGDATDLIEPGEIAFWLAGSCIAIGFGPTPASHGDEIRLASPANIWADSDGDWEENVQNLRTVRGGVTVRVEQA